MLPAHQITAAHHCFQRRLAFHTVRRYAGVRQKIGLTDERAKRSRAAANLQALAGNPPGILAAQKSDHVGNVFGLA